MPEEAGGPAHRILRCRRLFGRGLPAGTIIFGLHQSGHLQGPDYLFFPSNRHGFVNNRHGFA
jgi:hypothetical protein